MGRPTKPNMFGAVVGPDERQSLMAWAVRRNMSISEAIRHLIVLGIGGSLDNARTENEVMSVRREAAADHVAKAQPDVEFGRRPDGHRAPEDAPEYGKITVKLSPPTADTFRAWRAMRGYGSDAEALRMAIAEGKQKVEWN